MSALPSQPQCFLIRLAGGVVAIKIRSTWSPIFPMAIKPANPIGFVSNKPDRQNLFRLGQDALKRNLDVEPFLVSSCSVICYEQ